MKSLVLTLLALTSAGHAAASETEADYKTRHTKASVPACYQTELDALETALDTIKRDVKRTCKREGREGSIGDISVKRNNDCHGFDVSATFVCT